MNCFVRNTIVINQQFSIITGGYPHNEDKGLYRYNYFQFKTVNAGVSCTLPINLKGLLKIVFNKEIKEISMRQLAQLEGHPPPGFLVGVMQL